VQIHAEKSDGGKHSVSLFSRHLEDMTDKVFPYTAEFIAPADMLWQYPDVVYLVQQFSQDISSFILDAEIVAISASGGSLKSFQDLSNRARKDVKLHEIKVSVCVYAFDLMYLNGQVSALQSNHPIIYIKHNMVINGSHCSKSPFATGGGFSVPTSLPFNLTNLELPGSIMLKVVRVRRVGRQ